MFFDWCNYLGEAGNNLPGLDKIDALITPFTPSI